MSPVLSSSRLQNSTQTLPDRSAEPPCYQDVVIVGGGIVGLTLACALERSGLSVTLVEAQPLTQGLQNRRAYALTLLTSEIFQDLGLWDQIRPQITAFDQIRLADANYKGVVQFRSQHVGRSDLGYVAEHRVLLQSLWQRVQGLERVTCLAPMQVTAVHLIVPEAAGPFTAAGTTQTLLAPPRSSLTLTAPDGHQQTLHTPLVIAADGAQSPLRQGAGISTRGWTYWQSCIGFTVRTEHPHQHTAHEHFWPSGPFAILPLPDRRCQVVWTAPHGEAQRLVDLPEADFMALLQERFGPAFGALQLETPRVIFPVRLMQSDRYVQAGLALVGDAAHCCHPVGGQGMNLGIRDAVALAEVLTQARTQAEDWGSEGVLKRYDRWRRWENWTILGFTDLLDRAFSNQVWPVVIARRIGLHLLHSVPVVRRLALDLMTGQLGRKPKIASLPESPY
ncbi:MAG: FAD-dependent hydroxylase [Prochlorothrix sp.]|nr:FAD-dependent hydroxylase [Prochlorothrix sp.]